MVHTRFSFVHRSLCRSSSLNSPYKQSFFRLRAIQCWQSPHSTIRSSSRSLFYRGGLRVHPHPHSQWHFSIGCDWCPRTCRYCYSGCCLKHFSPLPLLAEFYFRYPDIIPYTFCQRLSIRCKYTFFHIFTIGVDCPQ